MPGSFEEIKVKVLPDCDICKIIGSDTKKASYDAKTSMGSWGYLCDDHFV